MAQVAEVNPLARLGRTTPPSGASIVGVVTSANVTQNNVQAVIDTDVVLKIPLASTSVDSGAASVGVNNPAGRYSEASVQGVLDEDMVAKDDLAASDGTGGTSLVATQNAGAYYGGTHDTEAFLQAGGAKDASQDAAIALRATIADLASTASGKGASTIGTHAGVGSNVETELLNRVKVNELSDSVDPGYGATLVGVHDADGLLSGAANQEDADRVLAIAAQRAIALTLPAPAAAGQFLVFDSMNSDRQGDLTLTNNAPQASVSNLGTLGSANDWAQATLANKPLFRSVAVAGKIGDLSAMDSPDQARYMTTPTFTAVPQRIVIAMLIFPTSSTGVQIWWNGRDASDLQVYTSGGQFGMYAGSGQLTGVSQTLNKWNIVICDFNGASSKIKVNGGTLTSLAGSPGTGGLNQCTVMAQFDAGFKAAGMLAYGAAWATTLPALTDIENYLAIRFRTKLSSFPV